MIYGAEPNMWEPMVDTVETPVSIQQRLNDHAARVMLDEAVQRFGTEKLKVVAQGLLSALAVVVFAVVVFMAPAAADGPPPALPPPAARVELARIYAEQTVAPEWSHCPELYQAAVDNWPAAADVWARLDFIFWREARCQPDVVNRYGCVGLMQVCRINHARLGVTRADLQDPAVNIAVGYQLYLERGWRPWWTRRWRP